MESIYVSIFWIGEIPRAAQYGIYKNADSISRIADLVPNINKRLLEQGTKGLYWNEKGK